jgi:hypothetical protein
LDYLHIFSYYILIYYFLTASFVLC